MLFVVIAIHLHPEKRVLQLGYQMTKGLNVMAIWIRLMPEDEQLFRSYAKRHNMTLSELVRRAVVEKIEGEYDLEVYRQAQKEYSKDSVSYSHDEVCRMFGID